MVAAVTVGAGSGGLFDVVSGFRGLGLTVCGRVATLCVRYRPGSGLRTVVADTSRNARIAGAVMPPVRASTPRPAPPGPPYGPRAGSGPAGGNRRKVIPREDEHPPLVLRSDA